MLTPLSAGEICQFLDISKSDLDELWRENRLRRSIAHQDRNSFEICHSSIGDLISYFLTTKMPVVKIDPRDIETWISAIAFLQDCGKIDLNNPISDAMEILNHVSDNIHFDKTISNFIIALYILYLLNYILKMIKQNDTSNHYGDDDIYLTSV